MKKKIFPVIKNQKSSKKTAFCFAYPEDLDQAYAFYCARYENISYDDFLQLGLFEFKKKLNSIPENEPLYNIIKSRTIDLGKIKNKDERKYWGNLKRINAIPDIYLSLEEINIELKNQIGGNKNGNGFNKI